MYFKNLDLYQFRNFSVLHCLWNKNLNIIFGKNGTGKTNLIEGLYLSTQGESFRYTNNNLTKSNSNEASIRTLIQNNKIEYSIKLLLKNKIKQITVNSKKVSAEFVKNHFPCIIFSPESLNAIKESADYRRILVDELISLINKQNISLIYNYKKVLKVRNKILKDFKDEKRSLAETKNLLEALNPNFITSACELTFARLNAIKNILPEVNYCICKFIKEQNVDISVEYVISDNNATQYIYEKVQKLLQHRLLELEKAELSVGSSLIGPHKHEIKFLYNGNDTRFFCSQGQQRAVILSFKMAQIVYHRKVHNFEPVLMLDDVLSELDQEKRSALISFLSEMESQIFVTTTDVSLSHEFNAKNMTLFEIENGILTERPMT